LQTHLPVINEKLQILHSTDHDGERIKVLHALWCGFRLIDFKLEFGVLDGRLCSVMNHLGRLSLIV